MVSDNNIQASRMPDVLYKVHMQYEISLTDCYHPLFMENHVLINYLEFPLISLCFYVSHLFFIMLIFHYNSLILIGSIHLAN